MNIHEIAKKCTKGFLAEEEGHKLYDLAKQASALGPGLEIGSYCGKSSIYLGLGYKENKATLFSIDHHQGSEEQQPGQEYFDPDLLDKETGKIDTFRIFRKTLEDASLEDTVVPIVSKSAIVAKKWATPLSLVFIDGGHTFEAAYNDFNCWAPHVMHGGYLLIHDIFPDPKDGGQAPYFIYNLAISSGLFLEMPMVNTLGILKRLSAGEIPQTIEQQWKKWNER
jgi:predicted O-methyltransferase YrrM